MTQDVEKLVERLRGQAKVHSDRASEMWTAYHTTLRRGRPLPWMCRQEEERAATLLEAAEALSSRSRPSVEEVARKLAELKGHRDTDAMIWRTDPGDEQPVWRFYQDDAIAILALFDRKDNSSQNQPGGAPSAATSDTEPSAG